MADVATTLIERARAAGIIDDGAARSMLDLHRDAARLGKFEFVEKIGEGGMGEVWKARQTDLGRTVALKLIKGDDPEDVARFIREAQTSARLSHPNIVATFEAGEIDGPASAPGGATAGKRHYISMEFVEGEDLKRRRVGVRQALELVRDAARAVHFAHGHGVVHRDLKPANLMLGPDGRVRVMDFGLARVEAAPGLSMTGSVMGTPCYMSPEQARGKPADARSDVYSLGATLYELVTGREPFEAPNVYDVLRAVTEEEPIPPRRLNPKLGRDVETILLKAMEKDPARRYPTAADLAEDLRRELAGEPIAARPVGRVVRAVKWSKRNPARALSIGLAAMALVVATGWALGREFNRRRAVAATRAAIDAERWDLAAERAKAGLAGAPDDADLTKLARTAEAGKLTESARRRRAKWDEALDRTLPALEARERELAADLPDHVPPSRKEPLWQVRRELRGVRREANDAREEAVQICLTALEFDPAFVAARRLVTDIGWSELERAEREGDVDRRRQMEFVVRRHGGAEIAARLDAQATVDLASPPAGATAYLFEFVEHKNRLVPEPPGGGVEWPPVDALPIDAPALDPKGVREATAYPLAFSDRNRVGFPLRLPAGSYLLVLRREGYDDLRLPVLLARGAAVKLDAAMDRAGDVPEGFVRVAAGPFVAGGDPAASDFTERTRTDPTPEPGDFCIQRFSVTAREYLEFLNDRDELDVERASAMAPRSAPNAGQYWRREGDRIVADPAKYPADWPVFAVSWNDATAYAAWYTKRHGRGLWAFDLPTEDEWEKAARGVDGRFFPYGNEFEAGFSAMLASRRLEGARSRQPESVGLFPADESPYGVRDMAGGVRNWTKTPTHGGAWRIVKGGTWGAKAVWCRSAGGDGMLPGYVADFVGFRLAARRASDEDY